MVVDTCFFFFISTVVTSLYSTTFDANMPTMLKFFTIFPSEIEPCSGLVCVLNDVPHIFSYMSVVIPLSYMYFGAAQAMIECCAVPQKVT